MYFVSLHLYIRRDNAGDRKSVRVVFYSKYWITMIVVVKVDIYKQVTYLGFTVSLETLYKTCECVFNCIIS